MSADWLDKLDSFRLVDRLFEETSASRTRGRTNASQPPWPASGPQFDLPARLPAQMGLDEVLAKRLSVRSYTSRPAPLAAIAGMLEAAYEFDEQAWPANSRTGRGLSLLLLARQVEDIAPAIYLHVPSRRALTQIAVLPDETTLKALFLQEEFALAPAVVVVVGALSAALCTAGSHAHRELLLRAGAASHTAMLAALGRGLSGCIFAGLVANTWRRVAQIDGYTRIALFACAVGYAHE